MGTDPELVQMIGAAAEPLPAIDDAAFGTFFDRFSNARVVMLGESTHGTSEFYRARAEISKRLIREHGFSVIAVESDWPDAARIDAYVRGREGLPSPARVFQRFPTWMWRNAEVRSFIDWLHEHNAAIADPEQRVGFYGLDLYSLPSSMDAVVSYLEKVDPKAAARARERYGCLAPFADDPAIYGRLAQRPSFDTCDEKVATVFRSLLEERLAYLQKTGDKAFLDAAWNAKVVAASEEYYRAMYEGSVVSWNLRDKHMFETLQTVLQARGDNAKAIVWAHNSHVGNASATQMGMMGEFNIGELARRAYGEQARLIGFGTDRGTVMAASAWDGPQEVKTVRPSLPGSYGALFRAAAPDRFLLDLRNGTHDKLRSALLPPRLERAIGVIYQPETERQSHYFEASLPQQFDAFIWLEETRAVQPLTTAEIELMPATYPFAL